MNTVFQQPTQSSTSQTPTPEERDAAKVLIETFATIFRGKDDVDRYLRVLIALFNITAGRIPSTFTEHVVIALIRFDLTREQDPSVGTSQTIKSLSAFTRPNPGVLRTMTHPDPGKIAFILDVFGENITVSTMSFMPTRFEVELIASMAEKGVLPPDVIAGLHAQSMYPMQIPIVTAVVHAIRTCSEGQDLNMSFKTILQEYHGIECGANMNGASYSHRMLGAAVGHNTANMPPLPRSQSHNNQPLAIMAPSTAPQTNSNVNQNESIYTPSVDMPVIPPSTIYTPTPMLNTEIPPVSAASSIPASGAVRKKSKH